MIRHERKSYNRNIDLTANKKEWNVTVMSIYIDMTGQEIPALDVVCRFVKYRMCEAEKEVKNAIVKIPKEEKRWINCNKPVN